jgi:hypothetical protein
MRELQMWCPVPLPEGKLHRRKLRSDKYKPPAGRLLENYESDLLVGADEDTDAEAGADPAAGVAKSRRRTRSMIAKKSASAVVTVISTVKVVEQKKKKKKKKKKKRMAASPPTVTTPSILTPRSQEVESEEEEEEKEKHEAIEELPVPEDQAVRRSESPAAKRQRELVQKTSGDDLRRGLETQRNATAAQAKIPASIKPRVFWPKTRLPAVTRYKLEGRFYLYTFYLIFVLMKYFSMHASGEATRGVGCPIVSFPHEVA